MRWTISIPGRGLCTVAILATAALACLPLAAHAARDWTVGLHVGSASGFAYEERFGPSSLGYPQRFGATGRLRVATSRRLAHGFSLRAESGWLPYHHAVPVLYAIVPLGIDRAAVNPSSALDISFVPMAAGLRYTRDRGGFGGLYAEVLPAAFWSRWRVHDLAGIPPGSFSMVVPGALVGVGLTGGMDRPVAFEVGAQWLISGSSGWRSLGSYGSEKFGGLNSLSGTFGLAVRL